MIKKQTTKAIKKAIGARPVAKIRAEAKKQKFFNKSGEPFSHSTFSRVLNGNLELPYIEDFILNFAENCLQTQKERDLRNDSFTNQVYSPKN